MARRLRILLRFVVCPLTAGLAAWQWRRLKWKEELLEDVRRIVADDSAEPLPSDAQALLALPQYRRFLIPRDSIAVDWKRCLRVGPYPCTDESRKKAFTEAAVCPCTVAGLPALMDLGMLRQRGMPIALIDIDTLQHSDWIVTRERSHKGNWFWGNKPGDWRTKDADQLGEHLGTLPVLLQRLRPDRLVSLKDHLLTDKDAGEEVLARIPNRHAEYVGTWAALCATSLVFSFFV